MLGCFYSQSARKPCREVKIAWGGVSPRGDLRTVQVPQARIPSKSAGQYAWLGEWLRISIQWGIASILSLLVQVNFPLDSRVLLSSRSDLQPTWLPPGCLLTATVPPPSRPPCTRGSGHLLVGLPLVLDDHVLLMDRLQQGCCQRFQIRNGLWSSWETAPVILR